MRERIEEGLKGEYEGLENGLGDRINKYIFGLQRACYTLIGGLSGSAKTTMLDYILLNAIQDAEAKGITINVIYYSWEIDQDTKKANWLSTLIYKKYGITIPPEKIKGLGKNRLTSDEIEIIYAELEELERIFKRINWVWESVNPTGMMKEWWNFMLQRGTLTKVPYIEDGKQKERITGFILNDPKEYNVVCCDHIMLAKLENGMDLKRNIDKFSEYTVMCRNLFKMSFLYLQQFNQGLNSIDRAKYKGVDISPQQSDFRDSTNPYSDADVVLGLMNASKMDMQMCAGYQINTGTEKSLGERFRLLKIIKNRFSRDNISSGLLFIPERGGFLELPEPKDVTRKWIDDNLVINR